MLRDGEASLKAIEGAGAIQFQGLAGDEGGGGREQEYHGGGDLTLSSQTLRGNFLGEGGDLRLHLGGIRLQAA